MKQIKPDKVAISAFRGEFSPECFHTVLENIYKTYTRAELIYPDPVEFPRRYADVRDREIVALIASSLAYGRVQQIHNSVSKVLTPMGDKPASFIRSTSEKELERLYSDFRHRFTSGSELVQFLLGVQKILKRYLSLEECIIACLSSNSSIFDGLTAFADSIKKAAGGATSLIASPADGSACKRYFLFLKWMVRHDAVDPGGWSAISSADLYFPIDTHMHKIARSLHFTERKQADLKTVIEVTRAFQKIAPRDPTRYDFALTRFGIRSELHIAELIEQCNDGVSSSIRE